MGNGEWGMEERPPAAPPAASSSFPIPHSPFPIPPSLRRAPSMSERLPLAVVLVRQREAWRKGQALRVEELLEGQPHLAGDDDAVLDLIYSERLLREEQGQAAPLDEYLGRFPRLEGALRVMFEVDDSLAADALATP